MLITSSSLTAGFGLTVAAGCFCRTFLTTAGAQTLSAVAWPLAKS
ncbi:hypothetical protein LINGRAHAP2_LOCUS15028 [Linum grandiflorum]